MFDRTFSGVLGPHFAQLKRIGGGGSGAVYSGVDTRFGFPVCIKRVSVTNKDDCRAALREIRIRRRLRHENIVGLLNVITSDGTDVSEIAPVNFRETTCIYLVQELLDADLKQVIESNNRLNDDYVKLFFYQLLRGLKYIHSANVLHRDLKPSNVMINVSSLEVRIGDFGNSFVLDPEYNHSNCLSSCDTSLWYKAPELIVSSSSYSTASDMWAAGCILAEMLLGRPLFEGENDMEQLEMIIHTIEINERDQVNVCQCLPEKVNKMYTGRPKFPLHSKFQKVDVHALHLLQHLLAFNARERVTTDLALSHPFLHEYSCVADEPVCLKPLHLEHEVDDFLEYTLKDLIVGECVALAEEQPRIHMQMSSCSSLMDIVKELNDSPAGESVPQSLEDGKCHVTITVTSDCDQAIPDDSGSDGSRFKVLEVLKEEHNSSSDSNGITSHEEGVSEEPLVSDHAIFTCSSSKFDRELHHHGHRRHHPHHRRKTSNERRSSGDEGSRLRKRKTSTGNRVLVGPVVDSTASRDGIDGHLSPEDDVSENGSHKLCSSRKSVLTCEALTMRERDSAVGSSELTAKLEAEDEKVEDLISLSRQLIDPLEDKREMESVGKQTKGPCDGHDYDKSLTIKEHIENGLASASDAAVDDVIRRSREILGEVRPTPSESTERKLLDVEVSVNDSVMDLISRSEQLLASAREAETKDGSMDQQKNMEINKGSPSISEQSLDRSPETGGPYLPTSTIDHPLDTMLSDPYHLKESNRRMLELFKESHTLLNNIKVDQVTGDVQEDSDKLSTEPLLLSCTSSKSNVNTEQGGHISNMSKDVRTDSKLFSVGNAKSVPSNPLRTSLDSLVHETAHENTARYSLQPGGKEIDLDEMRVVLDQARKLLQQSEEVGQPLCNKLLGLDQPGGTLVGETKIPELARKFAQDTTRNQLYNGPVLKDSDKRDTTYVESAFHYRNPVDCSHVSSLYPNDFYSFNQCATHFEVATVKCPTVSEEQLLTNNSVSLEKNTKSLRSDNESKDPSRTSTDSMDPTGEQVVSVVCEGVVENQKENSGINDAGELEEAAKGSEPSDEAVLVFSASYLQNGLVRHGTNGFSCREIAVKLCDDINVSHGATEKSSDGVNYGENSANVKGQGEENREDNHTNTYSCVIKPRGPSQNSHHEETFHIDLDSKKTTGYLTYRNGTKTNDTLSEKLNSEEIVAKLCRNNVRTDKGIKFNSKDDGLKNFYATLKIKSLMRNHSRSYREKRHDPCPF